jgi:ribosomal protein S19
MAMKQITIDWPPDLLKKAQAAAKKAKKPFRAWVRECVIAALEGKR